MNKYVMILSILLVVVLLLVACNRYINYENKSRDVYLEKYDFTNIKFKTGDIIFFRHDTPIYYHGDNGINMDVHVVKNISKTIVGFSQKYYSHVGMIVVLNNKPFVYHLTSKPHIDKFSGKSIIGTPSLVEMSEIQQYDGLLYLHRYKGEPIKFDENDIAKISSMNIKLVGKIHEVVMKTFLGIGEYKDGYMTCADFTNFLLKYTKIKDEDLKYKTAVDLEYIRNFVENNEKYYDSTPIMINTVLSKALR